MESTACWRAPVRNNCAAGLLFRAGYSRCLRPCNAGSLCRRGMNGGLVQHFFLYLLALGAGVSVATQQVLNGSLRTALGSPAWAGLVSYAGGLITMIVAVIALRERVPSWKTVVDVPWYAWSGGVFGAAFILLAILLLPSLGAATLFALVHCRPGARRGNAGSFRRVRVDAASDQRCAARRRGSPDRRRRLDQGVKFKAPARSRATPARPRATRETAATGLLRPACSSPPFVPRKTPQAFAVRMEWVRRPRCHRSASTR